jgi:hypothetical protein
MKSVAVLVSTSQREGQVAGSHEGCPVWPHVPHAAGVGSNGRRIDPDRSSTSMRFGLSCFAVMVTSVVVWPRLTGVTGWKS